MATLSDGDKEIKQRTQSYYRPGEHNLTIVQTVQ